MNTPITMPTLSDTMLTGRLVKWVKSAGDSIKKGDAVAEVETDKAVMDVEAFHDGFLAGPLAALNTDLPVGQTIGYIADAPGEATAEAPKPVPPAPAAAPAKTSAAAPPAPAPPAPGNGAAAHAPRAARPTPAVPTKTVAAAMPASAKSAAASGTDAAAPATSAAGIPGPSSVPGKAAPGVPTASSRAESPSLASAAAADHLDSSPLARRLAEQAGVALADIHGSGPHGRIVAADVEAARDSAPAATAHAPPTPASKGSSDDDGIRALYAEGSYDFVPHDGMRRIIAERLVQSNATIPHFQLTVDCDIGGLLAARHGINKGAPLDAAGVPLWDLSINDFVIKALAVALQRVPAANAIWSEAGMLRFRHSDVGVAVAIDSGLITPVVRNADTKSLSTISNEVKALAERARARKLKPAEYQGGVSTVSNLGMRGIREFTALINPPQSSIMAVGIGEPRPVGRNGQIVLASMMTVTLSCDHRVVDGALGAELIEAFKALLENPVSMAV